MESLSPLTKRGALFCYPATKAYSGHENQYFVDGKWIDHDPIPDVRIRTDGRRTWQAVNCDVCKATNIVACVHVDPHTDACLACVARLVAPLESTCDTVDVFLPGQAEKPSGVELFLRFRDVMKTGRYISPADMGDTVTICQLCGKRPLAASLLMARGGHLCLECASTAVPEMHRIENSFATQTLCVEKGRVSDLCR